MLNRVGPKKSVAVSEKYSVVLLVKGFRVILGSVKEQDRFPSLYKRVWSPKWILQVPGCDTTTILELQLDLLNFCAINISLMHC